MTQITMNIEAQPVPSTPAIMPYQFDGRNIRILEKEGEFWFVAGDVASELGYDRTPNLTRHLDDDEKGVHNLNTLGGDQKITIISEPGLYRAINQRRLTKRMDDRLKTRIGRFQRWVFHDVLPSIRKTGGYSVEQKPAIDVRDPSQLATIAVQLIEVNKELEGRAVAAEALVQEAKPKTEFYDCYLNTDGLYGLQNAARAINCRPNLFIRWLKEKYLFYQGGNLVARIQYIQMGVFEVKTTVIDDKVRPQAFITPRGLKYLEQRVPDRIRNSGAH